MSEFEANNQLAVKQVKVDTNDLYNLRSPEKIATEEAAKRKEVREGDINDPSTWELV